MCHANSCASPSSLAGIALACLRRKPTTRTLASKATELDWHDLHVNAINEASPIRLKSLRSHTRGSWEMICAISEDRSTNAWITPSGKQEWDACRLPSASHVWDQGEVINEKICRLQRLGRLLRIINADIWNGRQLSFSMGRNTSPMAINHTYQRTKPASP